MPFGSLKRHQSSQIFWIFETDAPPYFFSIFETDPYLLDLETAPYYHIVWIFKTAEPIEVEINDCSQQLILVVRSYVLKLKKNPFLSIQARGRLIFYDYPLTRMSFSFWPGANMIRELASVTESPVDLTGDVLVGANCRSDHNHK